MSRTPAAPTDADPELAQRVRNKLEHHGSVGRLTTLEGGRSGLTYTVTAGSDKYVVKAVPPGRNAVGRNDVLRQAVLLRALTDTGLPVPRVAAWDTEEPAWFAMSFANGEAIEPILDTDTAGAPLPAELARQRMLEAADVLGRLHLIPRGELAHRLAEVGGSAPAPDNPEAELDRWSRTMYAVPEQLRPGSAALLETLGQAVPAAIEPVLVHGDFRLGNLLCVGAKPTALVDWEIWGIGDPRVDLGWFEVFTNPELFPGVGHPATRLPDEGELLATYSASRRVDVDTDLSWFRALGRMKMAAIMGHNLRRHREGRHHDPVQERLPPTIAALIANARELLA